MTDQPDTTPVPEPEADAEDLPTSGELDAAPVEADLAEATGTQPEDLDDAVEEASAEADAAADAPADDAPDEDDLDDEPAPRAVAPERRPEAMGSGRVVPPARGPLGKSEASGRVQPSRQSKSKRKK